MSTELVKPSNHLFLCHPLFLLPSIFPSIRSFPFSQFFASGGKVLEFQPSALVFPIEYSGLISFRMDWFNLLEPQFPHLQGPETLEKMWPPINLWAGPGQWEASPSLPCPWNVCSVYYSYSWNYFRECILDRAMWSWEQLDWMWLKLLRSLHKVMRFWQWVQRCIVSQCPRQAL